MGNKSLDDVVAKVKGISEYQQSFKTVFNGAITMDNIEKAIAAYERTQIAFDTPFDRFMAGDQNAISASAKRGWSLFNGKGRCMTCHGWNPTQPLFTDNRFHNIGVSAHKADFVPLARKALVRSRRVAAAAATRRQLAIQTDMSGLGRFLVTKQPHDIGGFRTMGLRNLLVTQPYFHDGSQADAVGRSGSLQQGRRAESLSRRRHRAARPYRIRRIDDLVAFLATLTSPEYAKRGERRARKAARTRQDQSAAARRRGRDGQGRPRSAAGQGPVRRYRAPPQNEENPALLGGD